MRYLVTGAHGFLGSHLCDYLLVQGSSLTALVSPWGNLAKLEPLLAHPKLSIKRADISDPSQLKGLGKDHDVLIHVAAKVQDWGAWPAFEKTNVLGTKYLLEEAEAAELQRFVFISSLAVHNYSGFRNADVRTLPRNGTINAYAISKIKAEELVEKSSLDTVIIRPGLWPFGPRDDYFKLMLNSLKTGFFPLVAGGHAVINTAYIENLVAGIQLAATRPEARNKIYAIADEGMPSWLELLSFLSEHLEKPVRLISMPTFVARPLGETERLWSLVLPDKAPLLTRYRARLMLHDVHVSIQHAQDELGYTPKISWQEGFIRTLERMA